MNEISEFLTSRRARITPEQAGLRAFGNRRRVIGLRREEVAMLAGISVEYYTQLERGNVKGVSEDVLEAVIRALQLDEIERTHLFDLTRAAKQLPNRPRATPAQVRPAVQRVLDTITDGVAFIRNPRADFLTGNRLAYALYADAFTTLDRPVSLPRFVFLDPRARTFYRRWENLAATTVGSLRAEAARDPYDQDLTQLIGELSMRSDDFRRMWATHDVTRYRNGTQYFHHEIVGDLELSYESFDLAGDIAQTLVVYTAEPGSLSQAALDRLAHGTVERADA
ncbi:MAG: helix-turn-helix transcriptional regulator [Nocardioidaceae bacterium]